MTPYRNARNQDSRLQNAGAGCICHPLRPFLFILLKNLAEEEKTGTIGNLLKESAREWLDQFRIIH